jgi:signal peptidase I
MKASDSTRAWIAKLLILSAVAIVAVLMIGWYTCFRAFIISSGSMANTLVTGDRILVDRISIFLGAPVHHGDIVAYRWPLDRNMRYVHRVVGIPGDRLKIVNKHLYRNGVEVTEPYAQHSSTLIDSYRDNFPNAPNFPLREPAMDMLENHVVNGEVVVPGGPLLRDGRQSR